jgi:hypothetical protein
VRGALVLLVFAIGSGACARALPPAAPAPPPVAHVAELEPRRALASGCRARPETVYGKEPVVFDLQAAGPTEVDVELRDGRGRTLAKGSVAAPGEWRAEDLPSGDFTLEIGAHHLACSVTVNRELSRATEGAR